MLGREGIRTVVTPIELDLTLEVEETGSSFVENAVLKATAFMHAGHLATVADDSGLVVDALGGAPGIFSARYAGDEADDADRNALVLERLRGVPAQERTARFVCAIALAIPDREVQVFEGSVEGLIAPAPAGGHGFGYDPIFFYPPFGRTFGEVDAMTKDGVSHRGRALRAALPALLAI